MEAFLPKSTLKQDAGRIFELGQEYEIVVTKISERNPSKTCCLCGKQHNGRIQRGLMVCEEIHQSINVDVNRERFET